MENQKKNDYFYILAIDGGGIRGVFPAHLILRIQESFGIQLTNKFKLIAGTSTGSIIAAAVAQNIDIKEVISFYKVFGPRIFKKGLFPKKFKSLIISSYKKNVLSEQLLEVFGNIQLSEVSVPLLIPSTDIGNGNVHVFKSMYSKEFKRDGKVKLKDAILASCSAPSYFDPTNVYEYLLADGGLWANNPSLAAVIDAHKRLGIRFEDIRILSIGTGLAKVGYGVAEKRKWGLGTGWNATKLIDFSMSLQSQVSQNYLGLLLKQDQVLRLNFESDFPLPLDDCSKIDDLISRADKEFTYKSEEIKRFLLYVEEE